MGKGTIKTKAMTMAVAMSMVAGLCPSTVFAANSEDVAKVQDGMYTGTAKCTPDAAAGFDEYNLSLSVTIKDGKIESITDIVGDGNKKNKSYIEDAAEGVVPKIVAINGTDGIDAVSEATCSSKAIVNAVNNALENATKKEEKTVDTTALSNAIASAEARKEADYTAESWKNMQDKLTAAKEALAAKESQDAVDQAAKALTDAVGALVEKTPEVQKEVYVLMNIPYADFYKADGVAGADTVSSATKQKTRSSLAKGSYHVNSDGSDITGVTFPVKVSDISVLKDKKQIKDNASVSITTAIKGKETTTEYKGKDALFESDSYSYYVLSEEPSYYKELTVGEDGSFTFSAIKGKSAAPETKQVQAEFKTKSNYGDYQLKFDKTEFKSIINIDTDTVYGAVINTTDGTTYGLCHQENIWKGYELAWSTGYTTESHGCHLNSEHFESMMGKTIDSVTYYASNGIYTLDIADVKVLAKTGVTATVTDIHTTDTEAAVTLDGTLPEGFLAEYTVDETEVAYADGKITTGALAAGSHTLTISDANDVYAPIQASFYAKEANVPAVYDATEHKIAAADGITEDQLKAYIKTITSVTVGDKTYAASGKGATVIVKKDGTLDTSKLELAEGTKFVVTSSSYDNLEFSYSLYSYVYAGLTWGEYWSQESVTAAGNVSGSDEKDSHNESDTGAFDAVTRATTNHGLHRGSYQCMATIYTTEGNAYQLSYWKSSTEPVLADGTVAIWTPADRKTGTPASIQVNGGAKESLDHYAVTGIKYVPVQVKAEDYADFAF